MTETPKYKLCLACNAENAPWLPECGQYEAGLAAVPVTAAAINEYPAAKSFVSRKQAKLNLYNNILFIENLRAANPTFIHNEKLADNQPAALKDSSKIGLSDKRINSKVQKQAACLTFKVHT